MEAYIQYFFPSTKRNKPWFNSACSRTIRGSDAAFRDYHRLQTQRLMQLIFHPGIMQNLFFATLKFLFSVENAANFLVLFHQAFSCILQKKYQL